MIKLFLTIMAVGLPFMGMAQQKVKNYFSNAEFEIIVAPNRTYLFQPGTFGTFYDDDDIEPQRSEQNWGFSIGVLKNKPINKRNNLWMTTGIFLSYKQMRTLRSIFRLHPIYNPGPSNFDFDSLENNRFSFRRKLDIEVPFIISYRLDLNYIKLAPQIGFILGKSIFSKVRWEVEYLDYPEQIFHIRDFRYPPEHFINRLNLYAGMGLMFDIKDRWRLGIQPNVRFDIFPLIATHQGGLFSGDYMDEWVTYSVNLSLIKKRHERFIK